MPMSLTGWHFTCTNWLLTCIPIGIVAKKCQNYGLLTIKMQK